jgi:FdhD protein
MVAKAAAFGAATLVALSAPTSLAIERAQACGLTLIAVARADHATVFTGPDGETAA